MGRRWLWIGRGWLAALAAGCGGGEWACVSSDWVVDADGEPVEACVNVAKRTACEAVIGHPTYGQSCGASFAAAVAECPELTLTAAATDELGTLGASPDGLMVERCAVGGTGETGSPPATR